MGRRSVVALAATALLIGASGFTACSSESEDEGRDGSGGTGGILLREGLGGIVQQGGARAVISGGGAGNCEIIPDDEGCTGIAYEGESIPLDIYLMFDVSGSMISCIDPPLDRAACPDADSPSIRLNAIREATEQFLEDPASTGLTVGLGYFGYHDYGETSCDPADYATPAVEMGKLPGHADAIISSLADQMPTGETPTGAAVRGACEYTRDWQRQHPAHRAVQLFITDGRPEAPVSCSESDPDSCCPTLDDAVTAAKACRDGGIETYVLGVGPFLDNLDDVARAGGTEQAYLVSSEEDAAQQVLDALNAIRRDAVIPCELSLPPPPPGESLSYDKVNVFHADPTCNGSVLGYVGEVGSCGERGGWYYDDPDVPAIIELCPTSCELVGIPGSELLVTVGCDRHEEIR